MAKALIFPSSTCILLLPAILGGCVSVLEVGKDSLGAFSGDSAAPSEDSGDTEVEDSPVESVVEEEFPTDGAFEGLTQADWELQESSDGLPGPLDGVYQDLGSADDSEEFRALIGFPIRYEPLLADAIRDMYDPKSSSFREYLTVAQWLEDYGPPEEDVDLIVAYLEYCGFQVNFVANNRLLLQFTGTVGQFNKALDADLHLCLRENPQIGNDPFEVFCTTTPFSLPAFVKERTSGIVTMDLPVDPGPLPGEAGGMVNSDPGGGALRPSDIAGAYGGQALYDQGIQGNRVRLGVTIGGMFKFNDINSFWLSMGISRSEPYVEETMEAAPSRNPEATIDVEWSGALAPRASMMVYVGPDSRNTSMVYTFNEAIGMGEIDVLTNSFAHREDSEPYLVEEAYHQAAEMAAALGITVFAASGDSARPDTPCVSPYVTCVGGTTADIQNGELIEEWAWESSGSGDSENFTIPYWQVGVVPRGTTRAVSDVALPAGNVYWVYYLGNWQAYAGTSFASPAFAGLFALVDQAREERDLPPAGFLNPLLYTEPAVYGSFNDVTQGSTSYHRAGPGWDYPTGWGSPNVDVLAEVLP